MMVKIWSLPRYFIRGNKQTYNPDSYRDLQEKEILKKIQVVKNKNSFKKT